MTQRKFFIAVGFGGIVLGAAIVALGFALFTGTLQNFWFSKNELYSGHTIITGQRPETRNPGFMNALLDVVKKLSGDPTITADDVASVVHGNIPIYVTSFHDRDRMEEIPIHDEQGTRDRSFDLWMDFDKGKVDALLKVLGRKPWATTRPKTLVLLRVQNTKSAYVLNADEDDDVGSQQRLAFQDASWQTGLPLVLPRPKDLLDVKLNADNFEAAAPAALEQLVKSKNADVGILGHLIWVGGAAGWKADWTMTNGQTTHHWQIDNINFDGAFRNAMRGAAQILSNHGEPAPNLN
jgi:uncharacterized protein